MPVFRLERTASKEGESFPGKKRKAVGRVHFSYSFALLPPPSTTGLGQKHLAEGPTTRVAREWKREGRG